MPPKASRDSPSRPVSPRGTRRLTNSSSVASNSGEGSHSSILRSETLHFVTSLLHHGGHPGVEHERQASATFTSNDPATKPPQPQSPTKEGPQISYRPEAPDPSRQDSEDELMFRNLNMVSPADEADDTNRKGRRNWVRSMRGSSIYQPKHDIDNPEHVTATTPGNTSRRPDEQGLSVNNSSVVNLPTERRQHSTHALDNSTASGPTQTKDGTADRRSRQSSQAATLRLLPRAAAIKNMAMLTGPPVPKRRGSSSTTISMSEIKTPVVSENSWDQIGLLAMTDWWREILGTGEMPQNADLEMMANFLGEFLTEDMPSLEMIARTRLDRLLEAIIDAGTIHGVAQVEDQILSGLQEQDDRGNTEDLFGQVVHRAQMLEEKWIKLSRGKLYGMVDEKKQWLLADGGRLHGVECVGGKGEKQGHPIWVTQTNEKAGQIEYEAGTWWLNTTCAYRDGMIDNTHGYVTLNQFGLPIVVLMRGQELTTKNPEITKYHHEGPIKEMLLPLLKHLNRPVRIMRKFTLSSKLAPIAGVRYDGIHRISLYSFRRESTEVDRFRCELTLERHMDRKTIALNGLLAVPTASMLDDWDLYMQIRDDEAKKRCTLKEYEEWHRIEREQELEREKWHVEAVEMEKEEERSKKE